MSDLGWILLGAALALLGAWGLVLVGLAIARPGTTSLRDVLRLLPDTVRLLRRLATDPSVPRSARVGLWLLLAYLVSPIDLVPDFIPVLGQLDDAIVAYLALRSIVRRAGVDALRRHWPGPPEGLDTLLRVVGR